MTRKEAINEINDIANDMNVSFEEAALESIFMFYDAAGISEEQIYAEFGNLNSEQLINAYISIYS